MAAAANNLGVLGVSLITPRADAPALPSQDRDDYPDRCIGQMNNLIHGVATAAGQVMSLATVASRHVWRLVMCGWDSPRCPKNIEQISLEPPFPRKGSLGL